MTVPNTGMRPAKISIRHRYRLLWRSNKPISELRNVDHGDVDVCIAMGKNFSRNPACPFRKKTQVSVSWEVHSDKSSASGPFLPREQQCPQRTGSLPMFPIRKKFLCALFGRRSRGFVVRKVMITRISGRASTATRRTVSHHKYHERISFYLNPPAVIEHEIAIHSTPPVG